MEGFVKDASVVDWDKVSANIRRVLQPLALQPADVEDITQDVITRLLETRRHDQERGAMTTLAARVARDAGAQFLRDRAKLPINFTDLSGRLRRVVQDDNGSDGGGCFFDVKLPGLTWQKVQGIKARQRLRRTHSDEHARQKAAFYGTHGSRTVRWRLAAHD